MKMSSSWWSRGLSLLGICGLAVGLAGCGLVPSDEPAFSDTPATVGSARTSTGTGTGAVDSVPSPPRVGRFRVGDLVTVAFSGIEPPPAPHEERIKEDGTITLAWIGSVLATGKTAGELQKEIRERYVPKYYLRLEVTVKSLDQAYFVGGEVKAPGSRLWFAKVKVTQAIQSAGDFTDFANKKKVQLTRADGTKIIVNCKDAITHPDRDPEVLPGDTITVPRSIW